MLNICNAPFVPADILIPKTAHEKWAVVACDQYTSEPDYWNKVKEITDGYPSALNIILPEIYLNDEPEKRIEKINGDMIKYLDEGIFEAYNDAMIYTERTLSDGKIRRGIVGAVDLEEYDYNKGSVSLIRATEETVLERIPPRVKIRRNAVLEVPHIMILIDDPDRTVIEPVKNVDGKILYDFDLMLGGGRLKGKLIDKNLQAQITKALSALRREEENPVLFAVGDGNHSLAAAKFCYEQNKNQISRYALAEIINIHDEALEFEPIYRVMFNVDVNDVIKSMEKYFVLNGEQKIEIISKGVNKIIGAEPISSLTVGTLQNFIDDYVKTHGSAKVDYIHGNGTVKKLTSDANAVGFVFDGMHKDELFSAVKRDGVLPRKTFSMGEAASKRYYMECRKIK